MVAGPLCALKSREEGFGTGTGRSDRTFRYMLSAIYGDVSRYAFHNQSNCVSSPSTSLESGKSGVPCDDH